MMSDIDAKKQTQKTKILVVDDEALISMMLCKELNKIGFDAVNKAATAEDAVRSVQDVKPDFVFMDIKLIGKLDGIDAAEMIQAKRSSPLPIAFMTAYTTTEIRERAMKLQPAAFLVKPINIRSLAALINREIAKAS